ncbi:restriction endonuclease subunit S [Vibrio mimicus]
MSDFCVGSELPSGWSWRQLGEITEIDQQSLSGRTDSKFRFCYIDISSVSTGYISEQLETYQFSEAPSRARRVLRDFDILMSTVRPNLKSFAMFKGSNFPTVASTGFAVLSPGNEYDQQYIYACLLSEVVSQQIQRVAVGSNYPAINSSDVKKLWIPFPTLPIREKIGGILKTIDNQIDATQALIDKYTAIKQGMMADLFSRGIDPETKALRPAFEEAPELYHETPLGMLPKGWGVKTLGEISEKITSGSRDWAKFYSSEGDLFVRISNLTREHVNFRWDSVKYVNIGGGSEGERTQLQPGDILVSITADLGIVGVVPENMGRAYINQHTALIRLSTDGENARFIGNYLSSRCGQDQFEKNNDSGAKAGINLPTIASLRCPIPEGKEQLLIASKIDALDEVIADLKREKSKSLSLKQGLMQDLLTGKVPVPA